MKFQEIRSNELCNTDIFRIEYVHLISSCSSLPALLFLTFLTSHYPGRHPKSWHALYICLTNFGRHQSIGLPWWLSGKESISQSRRCGVWSLDQEDPLEKEMAAHIQFSCLGYPTDRGDWQATVHGLSKNWAQWSTQDNAFRQGLAKHRWHSSSSLLVNTYLLEHCEALCLCIAQAVFLLQWQIWEVVTETMAHKF